MKNWIGIKFNQELRNRYTIKNAVLAYTGKGSEDIIAGKVVAILLDKLGTIPLTLSSQPIIDENTAETSFSESADIADAFLDSL